MLDILAFLTLSLGEALAPKWETGPLAHAWGPYFYDKITILVRVGATTGFISQVFLLETMSAYLRLLDVNRVHIRYGFDFLPSFTGGRTRYL